jgi:hypothetical protein
MGTQHRAWSALSGEDSLGNDHFRSHGFTSAPILVQYQWSDAWILLATVYMGRKRPALLSDVIAVADYINHDIVTFEEMEGALARLTAGGFLVDRGGRLSPSRKTMAFYRSVTTPRRPVLTEMGDLQKLLGASDWNPSVGPKDGNRGVSYPSLTRERFDQAVQDYLSMSATVTGTKKKRKPVRASRRRGSGSVGIPGPTNR